MVSIDEFGSLVADANNKEVHDFRNWLFKPGMAYGDLEFWWSSHQQKRPRAHEGIDFFCYEDSWGRVHCLAQGLVPVPCDGRVVALCPDFLGQSVFVRTDQWAGQRSLLVFAHISPHAQVGQRVKKGDVIGTVAAAPGEVPAHLHVSLLEGDCRDLPAELSWPVLLDQQKLLFRRPFLM